MVDNIQETSTKDKVSERLSQIQSAMENISSSEEFKQYLAVMGKFYDYSLNNSILIALQNPNATHVAGYNQWQSRFERHVKKDEKGIEILAPTSGKRHTIQKSMLDENQLESFLKGEPVTISVTDKNTGKDYSFTTSLSRFKREDIQHFLDGKRIKEEQGYTWFKPVKVFDVSQTEGKDLPKNPIQVNELKGQVENFDSIMNAIQKVSPCKIEFAKESEDSVLQKGAKGYYSRMEERIVVKEGMSELQTIKTAIHEAAHAMLHNEDRLNKIPFELRPDRRDKEIQAESVACAACYYFGLDTSEYSFGYVAGWASADVEKFKESMKLIRETSSEIITAIDKELYPEKNIQKTNDKVIYFDLFDTLVKVDRGILEPYFDRETDRLGDNGTLKNAEQTIDRLAELHKDTELFKTGDKSNLAKYYENCMNNSIMNPDENILKMLKDLKNDGYKLCVISDAAYVDIAAWDKSPLAQYFDNTVFSCEVGFVKPDPQLYETAKSIMGNPENCIFVGDGGHDELKGAKETNMQTVKAEWLKDRQIPEIYQYSDIQIQNPNDLLKAVQDLSKQQAKEKVVKNFSKNKVTNKSKAKPWTPNRKKQEHKKEVVTALDR